MQIWQLNPAELVIVNTIMVMIVHMVFAWGITRLPSNKFNPDSWLFRIRTWEKGGALWQNLFAVKFWKKKLPDGAAWFKGGFPKKKLQSRDPSYLKQFRVETCRGEASHWLMLGCSVFFYLWNPPAAALAVTVYFVLANMPCIVVQRYNRPFLERLINYNRQEEKI